MHLSHFHFFISGWIDFGVFGYFIVIYLHMGICGCGVLLL